MGSLGVSIIGLFATRSNGKKINAIQADTKASRAQVENSHTTNLRVEQDERHSEMMLRFDGVENRFDGVEKRLVNVESDIRGIRKDVGRLDNKGEKLDDRIHDLENRGN